MIWHCGQYDFDTSTPIIMGILNVTPDSFSDGGAYLDPKAAVAIGLLPEELADCTVTGGNTALSGAAMVGSRILTAGGKQTAEGTLPDGGDDLRKRQELQIRILNLAEEEKFPETFLTKINFN